MNTFNTYSDLTRHMERLGLFHMNLTLDRMARFHREHGRFSMPIVHVVGTNGKGSTSRFFEAIARAHGLRTGLFNSPHFVSPRERVRVNGRMLDREEWVELANAVMDTPGGSDLTYFEFQTCLAMLAFERHDVDVAVMEAGLGGRFDATNVFAPGLTLLASVGMDHEKILGPTLEDIARDKSGALHAQSRAVTGPQDSAVMRVYRERADSLGIVLDSAESLAEVPPQSALGLRGSHQRENARLALAGWREFVRMAGRESRSEAEAEGLRRAFVPGRMQFIDFGGRTLILDGAHNAHALAAIKRALDAEGLVPDALVFACLADKDFDPMLPLLQSLTPGPVLVPGLDNERAGDARALAERIGPKAVPVSDIAAALASIGPELKTVLVCGSLYLLAEFYTLHPEFLTP